LLSGFIESLDFAADEAETAEIAIEKIARVPPQMVLLDVRLPGMSGIAALGEIRKKSSDLRVLLITAHGELRQAVEAMKSGADDYMLKPLDLDELEVAIVDSLGTPGEASVADKALPALPTDFIHESSAMHRMLETAAVVAPTLTVTSCETSSLGTSHKGELRFMSAALLTRRSGTPLWTTRFAHARICVSFATSTTAN
jgi:DNA-binding NtrC family response regulator